MKINLENLDQVHPVVLREIGGAMQRIAAALEATRETGATCEGDDAEALKLVYDDAPLTTAELAELADQLPTDAEAVAKAAEPVLLETPEQVDERLGEGSIIGAIAKDHLAEEGACAVLAVPVETPPEQHPAPVEMGPELAAPYAPAPVELDSTGLPWDERIHAGTKTHVKDGSWKFKPRTSEELKDDVIAELRLKYPVIIAPPVQTDPATGHVVPSAEEVFGDAVDRATGAPAATAAPAAEYSFVNLLEEVCNAVSSESITQGAMDLVIADRCSKLGITGLPDLQTQPELVKPFRDSLNDVIGAIF